MSITYTRFDHLKPLSSDDMDILLHLSSTQTWYVLTDEGHKIYRSIELLRSQAKEIPSLEKACNSFDGHAPIFRQSYLLRSFISSLNALAELFQDQEKFHKYFKMRIIHSISCSKDKLFQMIDQYKDSYLPPIAKLAYEKSKLLPIPIEESPVTPISEDQISPRPNHPDSFRHNILPETSEIEMASLGETSFTPSESFEIEDDILSQRSTPRMNEKEEQQPITISNKQENQNYENTSFTSLRDLPKGIQELTLLQTWYRLTDIGSCIINNTKMTPKDKNKALNSYKGIILEQLAAQLKNDDISKEIIMIRFIERLEEPGLVTLQFTLLERIYFYILEFFVGKGDAFIRLLLKKYKKYFPIEVQQMFSQEYPIKDPNAALITGKEFFSKKANTPNSNESQNI